MNVHRIHVTMEGLVPMDLTNLNVSAKQDSMEQPAEEKVSCWSLNSGSTETFPIMAKTC